MDISDGGEGSWLRTKGRERDAQVVVEIVVHHTKMFLLLHPQPTTHGDHGRTPNTGSTTRGNATQGKAGSRGRAGTAAEKGDNRRTGQREGKDKHSRQTRGHPHDTDTTRGQGKAKSGRKRKRQSKRNEQDKERGGGGR